VSDGLALELQEQRVHGDGACGGVVLAAEVGLEE
jgi:hypothetical protein